MYKINKIYEENIKKYKTDRKYSSQYSFYNEAKSRQFAGNISLYYKKYQGAYISSLTLLKIEQQFILTTLFSNTQSLF